MIDAVRTSTSPSTLKGYMVDLAEASRRHPGIAARPVAARHACSCPRATRAQAAASGREYATPDDVKAVAERGALPSADAAPRRRRSRA